MYNGFFIWQLYTNNSWIQCSRVNIAFTIYILKVYIYRHTYIYNIYMHIYIICIYSYKYTICIYIHVCMDGYMYILYISYIYHICSTYMMYISLRFSYIKFNFLLPIEPMRRSFILASISTATQET